MEVKNGRGAKILTATKNLGCQRARHSFEKYYGRPRKNMKNMKNW